MKAEVVLREAKPAWDFAKSKQNWFMPLSLQVKSRNAGTSPQMPVPGRDGGSSSSSSSPACWEPPGCPLGAGGGLTPLEVPGSRQVAPERSGTEQRLPGTVGTEQLAPPGTHLEPLWLAGDHSRTTKTTVGPPVVKLGPTQGELRKPGLSQCQQCPYRDWLHLNWDQLVQPGLSQSQQRLHWGHLWSNWSQLEPHWDN